MFDFFSSGSADTPTFNTVVNIVVFTIGLSMAFASGRAIAQTWRPFTSVVVYSVILTFAERFLHFALSGQPLLSIGFFVISFIAILAVAALGYRRMRVAQMTTQYSWLMDPVGSLGWKVKS